ncbi:hypothetical protein ACQQ2N_03580 [Dokdonella sp. MW10]|uniref:hypothetical protein n=1 Tax=Dokdonella sp. MW10 TaxID=2992926 RepID=UPI003F7E7CEC
MQKVLPFDLQRDESAQRAMCRQGLVGWVMHHPSTGIVLHLYRSLATAQDALDAQSRFHGVPFRILGVHAGGVAYEHADGRATQPARTSDGARIAVPLSGRRIVSRRIRHVADRRAHAG